MCVEGQAMNSEICSVSAYDTIICLIHFHRCVKLGTINILLLHTKIILLVRSTELRMYVCIHCT